MLQNENGFSALVLLILLLAITSVPVYYWTTIDPQDAKKSAIQGASDSRRVSAKPGFRVQVVSASPTWDFVEYLCKDKNECLSSLNAGRRLATVSGGETALHEVVVEYSPEWADYGFIKYFVRSGWYSDAKRFTVKDLGTVPGSEKHEIIENNEFYDVVLTPVTKVQDSFFESATFSDI